LGSGIDMKLAWIPPGIFLMGSPRTELGRREDEVQHSVTLTKGFYIGIYEVTQAQWQAVMGSNPSNFKGNDNHPAEMVSWNDCVEFCDRLDEKTGKLFRLPTEEEWEYACRAGTTTPFFFGETISPDQANYDGKYTYGCGPKGVYRQQTAPVGSFPANAWGLFDMHGNVWEWCADLYDPYSSGDSKDPKGSNFRKARVLRGGAWHSQPGRCRAANRDWLTPGLRNAYTGFRVTFCLD
jgi:formylglycine-generating enzyme required for sulfatase activity